MQKEAYYKQALINNHLKHPIRVHQTQLATGPYTTHYAAAGEGKPLLLLHGAGGDCTNFLDVIPLLAKKAHVIVPDMLGHGKTVGVVGAFRAWDYLNWLQAFITGMACGPMTLIGHSLGGALAIRYSTAFPGQVKRLVLVNAVSLGTPKLSATLQLLLGMFQKDEQRLLEQLGGVMFAGDPQQRIEMAQRYLDLAKTPKGCRGFLWMLSRTWHMALPAPKHLLTRLEIPTLILWGAEDGYFPPSQGKRAAKLIPRCTLRLIPGAAHAPFLEQPEVFAMKLKKFLE